MPFLFSLIAGCVSGAISLGFGTTAYAEAPVAPPAQTALAAPTAPATPAAESTSVAKAVEVKTVSVTRVVGEAGPRIVTSREVRMNEAIGQALQNLTTKTPIETKKRILDVDDPAFPAQVLKVLDEWTVFLEATEIGSKTADKTEVLRIVKIVSDVWKGAADWEKLEASPVEIREIVERKLSAQSLEQLKGDASLVNISDAEALQYFKKNRLRFGNLPFENFKDNIKSALIRSQTERRLTEWRAVLRRKYRVRNFVGA